MKLIKTTLIALTVTIGFFSNAQDKEGKRVGEFKKVANISQVELAGTNNTPEQIADKRAQELKLKEQLNEVQFKQVRTLFLKIEIKKSELGNVTEAEKSNALIQLKSEENIELDKILHPVEKAIIKKTTKKKTATSM